MLVEKADILDGNIIRVNAADMDAMKTALEKIEGTDKKQIVLLEVHVFENSLSAMCLCAPASVHPAAVTTAAPTEGSSTPPGPVS